MTNPLRQQMVSRAVQQAQNGKLEINLRNVAMFLPGPTAFDEKLKTQVDFELDADDLAPYLPGPTPVVETPSLAERLRDVELEFVPPTPPVSYQELEQKMLELERERVDLRFAHDTAIRDELNARHELEQVARAFMNGIATTTPDQLLKQHAASENERRRKIAAGEIPAPRRHDTTGPSVLDKYAAAQRGGRAGFAGQGYRRGAYGAAQRGQYVKPKLPSER